MSVALYSWPTIACRVQIASSTASFSFRSQPFFLRCFSRQPMASCSLTPEATALQPMQQPAGSILNRLGPFSSSMAQTIVQTPKGRCMAFWVLIWLQSARRMATQSTGALWPNSFLKPAASIRRRQRMLVASEAMPVVRAPMQGETWWMLVTELGSMNLSATFFSVRRTTASLARMAMLVRLLVLTALNAYSTWQSLPSGENTVMQNQCPWKPLLIQKYSNLRIPIMLDDRLLDKRSNILASQSSSFPVSAEVRELLLGCRTVVKSLSSKLKAKHGSEDSDSPPPDYDWAHSCRRRPENKAKEKAKKLALSNYEIKNPKVSRFDRLAFQSNFKHYLQLKEQRRSSPQDHLELGEDESMNEVLRKHNELQSRRSRQIKKHKLHNDQRVFMDHRSKIFAKLKKFNSGLIGKSALLDFLIVNPSVMLLYNISPLRLGLELENYDTDRPGAMSFKEFSTFLFMHRETNDPNDFYRGLQLVRANRNYHRSVVEAREYVGGAEVRQVIEDCFRETDIFCKQVVRGRSFYYSLKSKLARSKLVQAPVLRYRGLKREVLLRRMVDELYFVNEEVTLERLRQFFEQHLKFQLGDYNERVNELVVKNLLPMEASIVLNDIGLMVLKEAYRAMPKYGSHFVNMRRFVALARKNKKYELVLSSKVRREEFREVPVQNFAQCLARLEDEGHEFMQLEEIIDFFSQAGRPYELDLARSYQRFNRSHSGDSDSETHFERVRDVRRQRFNRKIQLNQQQFQEKLLKKRKFNVTIPVAFNVSTFSASTIHRRFVESERGRKMEEIKASIRRPTSYSHKTNRLYQRLAAKEEERHRHFAERKALYFSKVEEFRKGQLLHSRLQRRVRESPRAWRQAKPAVSRVQSIDQLGDSKLQRRQDEGKNPETVIPAYNFGFEDTYLN